jgi:hypothetical protein
MAPQRPSTRGLLILIGSLALATEVPAAGPPAGRGSHADLVALYGQFQASLAPARVAGSDDHSDAAVAARLDALARQRAQLADLNVAGWPRAQQVDWLLVRSEMLRREFELRVLRPWARDPGFYVDPLLQLAFTELPLSAEARAPFEERLRRVPAELGAARANLDAVAGDLAALALRNLERADGVGHEQPPRPVPPAGVIGWYNDLLERARRQQPELAPAIGGAAAAIREFRDWLAANRATMTAPAGMGAARLDWYLRHVKLLPFDSAQLLTLGAREEQRMRAFLALERWRNRGLAELQPAGSAADYAARIADADAAVRAHIVAQDLLTIPADIGEFDHNVPWMVRPGGRNFWEEVQFRDPRPDHVHAVIPGHRFDLRLARRMQHPIRAGYSEGARVEGWAVYLEEMFLQTGFLDARPRTRELFYLFGLKRASRVHVDVMMQRNLIDVPRAISYMRERVPWLDEDVARVDAEIYLRYPPGYGFGYTIGRVQMDRLLADRARQLGERFDLKAFHDEFLAAGLLPIALIRYQMTGLDDEVEGFWDVAPIPAG